MGCCSSEYAHHDTEHSVSVSKNITNLHHPYKLLLLGTGSSGKSTILKQLKLLHGGDFVEDKSSYKSNIPTSIVTQMKSLLDLYDEKINSSNNNSNNNNIISNDDENKNDSQFNEAKETFNKLDFKDCSRITPQIANIIKILWNNKNIKSIFDNRTNLILADSAPYFFNNISRMADENYEPTLEDMLLARCPTTGIVEFEFSYQNTMFELFDMGGQRSERNKWIHCFDCVHCIIFVASLSCYDQLLFEESTINSMDESIKLFSETINSHYFSNRRTSIILLLNKYDLYIEKINKVSLNVWNKEFEYDSNNDNRENGIEFIKSQFKNCIEEEFKKEIHIHITNAIEKQSVENVFKIITNTIINNAVYDLNIM